MFLSRDSQQLLLELLGVWSEKWELEREWKNFVDKSCWSGMKFAITGRLWKAGFEKMLGAILNHLGNRKKRLGTTSLNLPGQPQSTIHIFYYLFCLTEAVLEPRGRCRCCGLFILPVLNFLGAQINLLRVGEIWQKNDCCLVENFHGVSRLSFIYVA